jgi:predicted DNA-binding transcriptional regulator AlpA
MARRILRQKEALSRLSIGHTKFYEDFIKTGRLRAVHLGPKARGYLEDEIDGLIDQLAAERAENSRTSGFGAPDASLPANQCIEKG